MSEKVPEWVLHGLALVSGPVDWLVKVKPPKGLKKGQRFTVIFNNERLEATYGGENKTKGDVEEVFALRSADSMMTDRQLAWVDVSACDFDSIKQIELREALQRRNKGVRDETVPEWLSEGLASVQGPVDWMFKVSLPAGVKAGQRVSFNLNGEQVETNFSGDPQRATTHNVFALVRSLGSPNSSPTA